MRLNCPACGSAMSLDTLLASEGAREAVITALQLPSPLGKALVQYLGLFRPTKRQLSLDRVNSLLGELLPLIQAGKIERNGRLWAAPVESWRLGIEEMLAKRDKLTLPLKGHGYLLTIISAYTDKAEAQAETESENRRAGRTVASNPPSRAVVAVAVEKPAAPRVQMPASVKAQLGKFKSGGNDDCKT